MRVVAPPSWRAVSQAAMQSSSFSTLGACMFVCSTRGQAFASSGDQDERRTACICQAPGRATGKRPAPPNTLTEDSRLSGSCSAAQVFQVRCCTVWTMAGHGLGARSSEGPLRDPRASGPFTQHNAQSRHAPHFSLCCSSAVQVLSQTRHGLRLQCTALWT